MSDNLQPDPATLAVRIVPQLFGPTARIHRTVSAYCYIVECKQIQQASFFAQDLTNEKSQSIVTPSKYFFKLFRDSINIEKIRASLHYYRQIGFQTTEIIKSGFIDDTDYAYIIYSFLEGDSLYHYAYHSSRRDEYLLHYGEKIGANFKKLRSIRPNYPEAFDINHVSAVSKDTLSHLDEISTQPIFTEHFSPTDFVLLRSNFIRSSQILDGQPKFLIHGDVKTPNFLIDSHHRLSVVDVESTCLGDDILNFQYQLIYALSSPIELPFAKGFLNGIYGHTRPASFKDALEFAFTTSLVYAYRYHFVRKEYTKISADLTICRKNWQTILDSTCPLLFP